MSSSETSELASPEPLRADDRAFEADRSPLRSLAQPQYPVFSREIVSVLLIVLLCDLTIYRGHGYAGLAVLLLGFPLAFAWGLRRPTFSASTWLLLGMSLLLAARLLWIGSILGAALGFGLIVASAIALQGRIPHVLTVVRDTVIAVFTGALRLFDYTLSLQLGSKSIHIQSETILLPLVVVGAFGAIFVMANAELLELSTQLLDLFKTWIENFFINFPLRLPEVLFWAAVAWIVAGLFRNGIVSVANAADGEFATNAAENRTTHDTRPLYALAASRNTLIAVVVLFAVYLTYEYYTQWIRKIPRNFDYDDYCHQGAAWLTVALAVATLTLSLIFRDNRSHSTPSLLRKLAWIWSVENLLLAFAVYTRVHIYISAAGMTRLRMVALFGVTTVAVGFVLVIWKIRREKSFTWLIGRQLWALTIAIYLFALTPVDAIVYRYNTQRIMAGDLRPVMPMLVHPIDPEGVMMLVPLVDSPQQEVREGAAAILAGKAKEMHASYDERQKLGWTSYQAAEILALQRLDDVREKWLPFLDETRQHEARERLLQFRRQRTVVKVD